MSRWRRIATCGCSLPSLRLGPSAGSRALVSVLHRLGVECPLRAFSKPGAAAGTAHARVQVAQVIAGCLGRGQGLQHHFRIAQARLLIQVLADLRRIEAAAARMPGILESGEPQFDLCAGQRVRCCGALRELRQLEGRCRQSPVVGLADFSHGVAGLGREAVARHPKQGLIARGVECGERGAVLALDIASGGLGQLSAYLGEHRVDRRRRRRLGDGGCGGRLGSRRRCGGVAG